MDNQESFREVSANFNFLKITWESKGPEEFIFRDFRYPEIQNIISGEHHGGASEIHWLR